MKKEQSIINKDDFFAGKLTEEQEKQLRNNEKDPFFEILREEKEIKMELSFDDFMTKVETNQQEVVEEPKGKRFLWRKISGIAASVLIGIGIGMIFFLGEYKEVDKDSTVVKIIEPEKSTEKRENIVVKEDVENIPSSENFLIKEEEKQLSKVTKSIKNENQSSSSIQSVGQSISKSGSEDEYSSDYVVVNGEPVENFDEAKVLAYTTMKLFSKNIDQGAKAIGQLKSLSIEL
ncbi:hypothetical protein AS589_17720 [Empedobacter brevis]|uniref:hypothetical protein n=1 Tax=Empedobacter brevis TaxID=247 RepID=UPI00131FD2BB|nr:hypothetical protein [Empedobacter brevis]QHC86484.1 hypothetical protein AS589_17720 [Empedobacter brevis]